MAQIYLAEARMLFSDGRFDEAKCQRVINLAGKQYKDPAAKAKLMLGLMQSAAWQTGLEGAF